MIGNLFIPSNSRPESSSINHSVHVYKESCIVALSMMLWQACSITHLHFKTVHYLDIVFGPVCEKTL